MLKFFLLSREAEESRYFCCAWYLYESTRTLEMLEEAAGERGGFVFDDKHRVPLGKLSTVFAALRTNLGMRCTILGMHTPFCVHRGFTYRKKVIYTGKNLLLMQDGNKNR